MKQELINENSVVLFTPDEADQKQLEKICRRLNKTEEEVLSAAFQLGLPLLNFLGEKVSPKT